MTNGMLVLRHAGSLLRAAVGVVIALAVLAPAQAQRFDERYPDRPGRQQQFFSFPFFSPSVPPPQQDVRPAPPVDSSRAPPPRKLEAPPATTIAVVGDSMADWLAHGLDETFSDTPETGVVRKVRHYSGLIRYEPRNDTSDWAQALREFLANEKPAAVVMMIGLHDRQSIRERAPRPMPAPAAEHQDQQERSDQDREQPAVAAPEQRRPPPGGNHEFRSERWVDLYVKRIDDTIAVLKSKGVPVLWVGLPAIRGTRSSADASFLNDLYRTRAEKAGIFYIDVWDGFVDEAGKFATQGPDPEGQIRRLRTGDGVHFTKAGARKLAHFVERDLRRALTGRLTPIALPTQDEPALSPATRPGVPPPRPVAGPVVPLTAIPADTNELLGGGAARPAGADPVATRVLTRGEAVAAPSGRADDFGWPRRSTAEGDRSPAEIPGVTPAVATPARPPAAPGAAQTPAPRAGAKSPPPASRSGQAGASASSNANGRQPPRRAQPRPDTLDAAPRPPMPIGPTFR